MDVYIRDACKSIIDKKANFLIEWQWLVQLVHDVQETYHLKYQQCQFSSSSYGIILPSGSDTFLFSNENRNVRGENAHRSQVLDTVNDILQSWLCYPTPGECQIQAWLVHVLVKEFGRPVLYLDSVWKTYTGVRRRSIDAQPWYISSFEDVKPLQQAAACHPLSNQSSSKSCALQELAKLVDHFMANGLKILPEGEDLEKRTASVYQLDCVNQRMVEIFTQFVKDCLSIFLKQNQGNAKLKKEVERIPDKLIPFREHAPSRQRFRSDDGPFSMVYARMTEGAYSAAVWWGVTFATPFSINNRMIFTS